MIVSEARIAANRANALKSTGPRTAEGKERSRCNAIRHGLTGAGVALSGEEAEAVEGRLAGFEAAYRPVTAAGRALARRAALLSVRVERCVLHEAAAISARVRAAEADFDEAREAEADHLMETIGASPARNVRRLIRMPEGVDRMFDAWEGLASDLAHSGGGRWGEGHSALAVHLTGRRVGDFGVVRVEALGLALVGDFSLLTPEEGAGLDPARRRDWARREMMALIVAEVARLEAHRESIDLDAIAADRAGAGARALFDPGKEATLARKYEAAAERGMHRALGEMRAIEAEAAAGGVVESRARAGEMAPAGPAGPALGSSSPGAVGRSVPPAPSPSPAAPAPRLSPQERWGQVPMAGDRPNSGPI